LEFQSDNISCSLPILDVVGHKVAPINKEDWTGREFFDVGPISKKDITNLVRACYHVADNKQSVKVPYQLDSKNYVYAVLPHNKQYELKINYVKNQKEWAMFFVKAREQKDNTQYQLVDKIENKICGDTSCKFFVKKQKAIENK